MKKKSLALELHDDAITEVNEHGKVIFESFEGVSPRRYQKISSFLQMKGKIVSVTQKSTPLNIKNHIDIQFIDSYLDFENRVVDIF
ncbi:hypothetical protein CTI69_29340 (plasmid) [Klebsiella pneumoniae]|uniref:hypothetical protein n=1 Tax=Klebsiella pneumoniae TaxID=573 RepID=UPI000C18E4F9|nr:hypothetical protein [Klebsiella pneumoniae]ATR77805.1 hypothetical protein CTI69_29340 [Klebsiella pneumoniae]